MTTTKPLIPESLKVNVLSRWIDWCDIKNPRFKFIVEVVKGSERMTTEYSGGILAFVDQKNPTFIRELDNMVKYSGDRGYDYVTGKYGFQLVNRCVHQLMQGMNFIYTPSDKGDVASQAITFLFSHSHPKAEDVLYSLFLDSDAAEMDHREFCDTFRYDIDSIKDKKVWEACKANSESFKRVVGKNDMEILREIFQDY